VIGHPLRVSISDKFVPAVFLQRSCSLLMHLMFLFQAHEAGKMPIVVGGTGMYLRWLLFGAQGAPKKDQEVYAKVLTRLYAENNWDLSIARLNEVDPVYAATIPRNSYKRLARCGSSVDDLVRPPL
jgi:tRNA A37 N6-isopentenylltransferase MiaA